MATDPRDALNRLIAALENHFDSAQAGGGESPALDAAEERLRDAFFTYDDELFTTLGVELPFDIVEEEDFDDDDDDEDDEGDDPELTDIEAD